jgi:hypothetical protein
MFVFPRRTERIDVRKEQTGEYSSKHFLSHSLSRQLQSMSLGFFHRLEYLGLDSREFDD